MDEEKKTGWYVEDRLNSFLCVGWVLLTLLLLMIEKLKLVMMSKIGSRHLSFASVARRCFQSRLSRDCFATRCVSALPRPGRQPQPLPLSHSFSISDNSRELSRHPNASLIHSHASRSGCEYSHSKMHVYMLILESPPQLFFLWISLQQWERLVRSSSCLTQMTDLVRNK
jgi:hypothetical protein